MTLSVPDLQKRLLSMLSPMEMPTIGDLGSDWQPLLEMAQQHRVAPMLRWRLSAKNAADLLPEPVSSALARAHSAQTLRALLVQRELLAVHQSLTRAGIPYAALKGAYLAWHVYPLPGLRPLRDLDILVQESQVMAAYQALLASGLSRHPRYPGTPEAALKLNKHLPPLKGSCGNVTVELHSRMIDADPERRSSPDISDMPGFWQRRVHRNLAGQDLFYTSATDLLLHLLVHAICEHKLDNGPLLFSDILFLLDTHEIDWPLFWHMAESVNRTRGALLGLRLIERHGGKQRIADLPESVAAMDAPPDELLDRLSRLSLRDVSSRGDISFSQELAAQTTLGGKIGVVLTRTFPSRSKMAAEYPAAENSPLLYLYYFSKLQRLAITRLPSFLRTRKKGGSSEELLAIRQMDQWIRRLG